MANNTKKFCLASLETHLDGHGILAMTNAMCYECCKQFKGWLKSFTRTEVYLSVAQAILLTGFIAFLTFLILHFIVCNRSILLESTTQISHTTNKGTNKESTTQSKFTKIHQTLPRNVQCTWEPSLKTDATHYYYTKPISVNTKTISRHVQTKQIKVENTILFSVDIDGTIDNHRKSFILALVRIKPPFNIVFGCILTIVNKFWTITAASCIESIEEVDSLDSFVIMERFGEDRTGPVHTVSDVNIHPLYQGANISYDLAGIKSEDSLNAHNIANLPSALDHVLITLGEGLDILGFGKFRSIDRNPFSRPVRRVAVNIVPLKHCEPEDESWSLRHLSAGEPVSRGGCSVAGGPVCAAPGAGGACNYCAGAPLMRGRVLLAIMSENRHCGFACAPNLYVNLAAARDWLDTVVRLD